MFTSQVSVMVSENINNRESRPLRGAPTIPIALQKLTVIVADGANIASCEGGKPDFLGGDSGLEWV